MKESGQDSGLLLKAAYELRVAGKVAGKDFEGDIPIHPGLVCLENCCHAPLAQRSDNAIWAKLLTGEVFHDVFP
jgi:hypothetical protein